MSDGSVSQVSEEFVDEVRDALAHFYDYAHLVRHPLLRRLQPLLASDGTLGVQKMRRLLLETIEDLRPRRDGSPGDASWRPYEVLYRRYVLGKEPGDVEVDLALGRRQIQREQRRALEALAIALWDKLEQASESPGAPAAGADTALWQEISRIAAEQQVFDAAEQLERAIVPVRSLADSRQVQVEVQRETGALLVTGDPSLLRQLLVATLSFTVCLMNGGALAVTMTRQPKHVMCTLSAMLSVFALAAPQLADLPESTLALATAQNAHIILDVDEDVWRLQISLPLAERAHTVAIVEDNKDLVALFARYLAAHGYQLVAVTESTQAIERLAEIAPDAVILDVMMRDVDGWEILQRLKADRTLQHIPVVICSVLDEPQLATSLGAAAYLRKPVRPAQLLECLAGLLLRPHSSAAGSWPTLPGRAPTHWR